MLIAAECGGWVLGGVGGGGGGGGGGGVSGVPMHQLLVKLLVTILPRYERACNPMRSGYHLQATTTLRRRMTCCNNTRVGLQWQRQAQQAVWMDSDSAALCVLHLFRVMVNTYGWRGLLVSGSSSVKLNSLEKHTRKDAQGDS